MKKLLLILMLMPLFLHGQKSMRTYYSLNMLMYDPVYYIYDEPYATQKIRKQLKIKEVRILSTDRKGKQTNSLMTFNQFGKRVHFDSRKKKIDYTYESDSLETSILTQTDRKTTENKNTYVKGKIASREFFENKKLKTKTLLTYNDNNKVVNTQMEAGRKKYEIRNAYNEDNKISHATYLINGKIKKEWIYECKPEGEVLASKTVELSSVCTYREESADGSYTTFTRSLREGKPFLYKRTFNKDSVMIASQNFMNDTTLVWEMKKENGVETSMGYKKSGKRLYKQVTVYNASGNVLSKEYFSGAKDKSLSKTISELNADGTTKSQQYFFKGKLQRTVNYEYNFF